MPNGYSNSCQSIVQMFGSDYEKKIYQLADELEKNNAHSSNSSNQLIVTAVKQAKKLQQLPKLKELNQTQQSQLQEFNNSIQTSDHHVNDACILPQKSKSVKFDPHVTCVETLNNSQEDSWYHDVEDDEEYNEYNEDEEYDNNTEYDINNTELEEHPLSNTSNTYSMSTQELSVIPQTQKTSLYQKLMIKTKKTKDELLEAISQYAINDDIHINFFLLEAFALLLSLDQTFTNICMCTTQMYPLYYKIEQQKLIEKNQKNPTENEIHSIVANKIKEIFIQKTVQRIKKLDIEHQHVITRLLNKTLLSKDQANLKDLYLKICMYCDLQEIFSQNICIDFDQAKEQGVLKLKRALEACTCIDQTTGITQKTFTIIPKFFQGTHCIINEVHPSAICAVKTEYDDDQRQTLCCITEEEYACIVRMLIRYMCNNGIYDNPEKTIYDSRLPEVSDMLASILHLYDGILTVQTEYLDCAHTADIITQRAIFKRRIKALKTLQSILNKEMSKFTEEEEDYSYIYEFKIENDNDTPFTNAIVENNQTYGQKETNNLIETFNSTINNVKTLNIKLKYDKEFDEDDVEELEAQNTPFTDIAIQEICERTKSGLEKSIYRHFLYTTTQDQAKKQTEELLKNLYKKIQICMDINVKIASLNKYEKQVHYFLQMQTDTKTYEQIRRKKKIQDMIIFYITQCKKIEKYLQKSTAMSLVLQVIEKQGIVPCIKPCIIEQELIYKPKNIHKTDKIPNTPTGIINPDVQQEHEYWTKQIEDIKKIKKENHELYAPELTTKKITAIKPELTTHILFSTELI